MRNDNSTRQPARITNAELRQWSDFLDLEIQIFEAYIWGLTGKVPAPFDPAALALLKANDEYLSKRVEAALGSRVATGDWSHSLLHDELVSLWYRAVQARQQLILVASVQEGAPHLIEASSPFDPPDPADSARFIRWLFIDVWEVCREALLKEIDRIQGGENRRA